MDLVVICRVPVLKLNEPASAPPIEYVRESLSASVAAGMTAPTFVFAAVFSGMERDWVGIANTGALLAEVLPLPEADQGPSPSALVARTCTS